MSHRVFVGKLAPDSVTEADLNEAFSKYGEVVKIDIKTTYAFVFYEHADECDAAIKYLDGQNVNGNLIIVQSARGSPRDSNDKAKQTRRNDLRLTVVGLDQRTSWQDLKDWAREAGDVTFANVFTRDNKTLGVVEYMTADALSNALLVLPDTPLKGLRVEVFKDQDGTNKFGTGRNDQWGNQGFQQPYVNARGGPGGSGDFGDRDRQQRDPYNDRRPYESYERFPPRGAGGGGYGRNSSDSRGGYHDRAEYRGYEGPHGYEPRGPPGPPYHYSDNRRFSEDVRRGPPNSVPGGYHRDADRSRSRSRERGGGYPQGGGYGYDNRGGGYNSGYPPHGGRGGYGDSRGPPPGRFYDGPPPPEQRGGYETRR